MEIDSITDRIIGAAIAVHRAVGPGLLESAYEACLVHELNEMSLKVERQKPIPLIYKSVRLDCGFRADLFVEDMVIVELKAKEKILPIDEAQLLSYLRMLDLRVGLIINFHVDRLVDGIKRMANRHQDGTFNSAPSAVKKIL